LSEKENKQDEKNESITENKQAENSEEISKIPTPVAVGDERVTVTRHDFYNETIPDGTQIVSGVKLEMRNNTDSVVASVHFDLNFINEEGRVFDSIASKVFNIQPQSSNFFRVTSAKFRDNKIKSYDFKILDTTFIPEPFFAGNDYVTVLRHSVTDCVPGEGDWGDSARVEAAIANATDKTLSTILFDVEFLDIEGNVISTTEHVEQEIKPGVSRAIMIKTSIYEPGLLQSYNIKIAKVTTADVERFQFRRQEMSTKQTGEEEIIGTIKNLGTEIGSTAVVAAFYDYSDRNIGTKVIIVSDIEPDDVKKFRIVFKPQEGDVVRNADLQIAQLDEYLSY